MYKLLSHRRSIRRYKDIRVEDDKVELLIRSILRSPSGKSVNPWEIIYIEDEDLVHKLSVSKAHGASFLKGVKQCMVILADPEKTDVWIEDASIAMTIGHLVAADMGLGSCWIQIRNRKTADGQTSEDFVRQLLGIPQNLKVEALLAFGYGDEDKSGHKEETLNKEKVHKDQYSKPYYQGIE